MEFLFAGISDDEMDRFGDDCAFELVDTVSLMSKLPPLKRLDEFVMTVHLFIHRRRERKQEEGEKHALC